MQRWIFLCVLLLLPTATLAAIGDAALQAQILADRVGYGAAATGGAGIVLVTFLVNASERCAVQNPFYQCDWVVPAANKRVYQLQARAVDMSGQVWSSPIIEVIAQ